MSVSCSTAAPHYAAARAWLYNKYARKKANGQPHKPRSVEDLFDPVSAKSLGIQENDLWIASVALQYHLVLVTADKLTHIREACPQLRVENWLEA